MSEQTTGAAGEIIECPYCHQKTPSGAFCANCGRSLANASTTPSPVDGMDPEILDDGDADIEVPPTTTTTTTTPAPEREHAAVATRVEAVPEPAPAPKDAGSDSGGGRGRYFRSRIGKALSLGGRNEEDPVYAAIEERQRRPIEDYRRIWDTPPSRFRLLPPTLAPARQHAGQRSAARAAMRASLGLAPDTPTWLTVASAPRTKGLDSAVAALAAHPDAVMLVAGIAPG